MTQQICIDDKLTKSQQDAVNHKDGPLLVLAGPGSGKTRVITARIATLIQSGVAPHNICAITFTNKAADEMRHRLQSRNVPHGVTASTFHSLCVRILRMYPEQAGIKHNFTIYDDSDQKRIVKEAIKACDLDSTNFPPSKMLEAISRSKNDLETPQDVLERADEYFAKSFAKVYRHYQDTLDNNNALDFDDLLMKVALLLKDWPDVRQQLSDRYKYLLVDEYQDTNHAQYQIAKGLALAHGNICVTGDPDQSIYRWRGADIGNILAFEKDWPSAVVIRLEENFRSTPDILDLADKLIANNVNRKQKKLIATMESGDKAEIDQYEDAEIESARVASRIKTLIDLGTDPNEIAVFYRVNSMSRQIEESLVRQQLPYQVVRGVEFYSRKEIRDLISYLKLIANPDDNSAFMRAIGTHPRGIGKTTLVRLEMYADENNLSLLQAAQKAAMIDGINKPTQGRLAAFAAMINGFIKEAEGKVAELMESVLEESGMLQSVQNQDVSDLENITELINAASKYDEQTDKPNLVEYLQSIALYSDTDAYDAVSGKVSLMSLHAAKGLEFDNAFIIGLEEGLLPHDRSINGSPDELEEERRLFFVGITRARKRLYISHAKHRVIRGQFIRTTPSRFLYEIEAIEKERFYDTEFAQKSYDDGSVSKTPSKPKSARQPEYVTGQIVQHKKFGMGKVKEFMDLGESSIVVVRFNSGQTKSLMVAYANLVKMG